MKATGQYVPMEINIDVLQHVLILVLNISTSGNYNALNLCFISCREEMMMQTPNSLPPLGLPASLYPLPWGDGKSGCCI